MVGKGEAEKGRLSNLGDALSRDTQYNIEHTVDNTEQ